MTKSQGGRGGVTKSRGVEFPSARWGGGGGRCSDLVPGGGWGGVTKSQVGGGGGWSDQVPGGGVAKSQVGGGGGG